jgi:hypothetical protein
MAIGCAGKKLDLAHMKSWLASLDSRLRSADRQTYICMVKDHNTAALFLAGT